MLVDAGNACGALAELARTGTTSVEVDAAMHAIELSSALPCDDGAEWVFVTRWDAAPATVALVSDLNAWSTTATPATRGADGVHFVATLPHGAAAGAKYKWFGAPSTYEAPPEATAYDYDSFGEVGYVAPPTAAPWLERFPAFTSAHLAAARTLRARLPAGFVAHGVAAAHARTVLFHDGQNLFDPSALWGGWHAQDALGTAAFADVVALAVDNAPDRMDAYTHTTDDPMASGTEIGGRAADYLALLDDDALPFFRARYGVVARGPSLVMAGSSLGGLLSLDAAMTSDARQGCVIAMSATAGWGSIGAHETPGRTLIDLWPASGHRTTAIYLDSGGDAGSGGCPDSDGDGIDDDSTTSSDNYCEVTQLRDVLAAQGYAFGVDLTHWHEPGALHDEVAWAARLPRALAACASMRWSAP